MDFAKVTSLAQSGNTLQKIANSKKCLREGVLTETDQMELDREKYEGWFNKYLPVPEEFEDCENEDD